MMLKIVVVIIAIATVSALVFGIIYTSESQETSISQIAIILPEGGFSPTEDLIAAKMAVDDFNQKHNNILNAVYPDSGDVLQDVMDSHRDGINLMVGPHSSAQLSLVRNYVDSNGITMITPTSTAPSLALDDKIYRLAPDDTNQAKAVAALLKQQHIDTIVLLVREDTWGTGLAQSINDSFDGTIVDKISYSAANPEIEEKTQDLVDSLNLNLRYHSNGNFAVIVLGFEEETLEFMKEATKHSILDDVRWYGTDSITNSELIASDPVAFDFIQTVSFKSLLFAVEPNPIHDRLEVRLYENLGYIPSAYAYSVYDSVWLAALSAMNSQDIESTAESYSGALGNISLNDAGDLESANYDVWTISYGKWYKVGAYDDASHSIVWGN